MHRIDTPTAQVDKFGPGKNGFTNGDPATGRRATDLNSDMWDAVQEEISAVIEKAGLTLNKDQHDQLHQAIEKIIAGKIPDALLKKNNLSDLADKALARGNLQLKTAAQRDIVTSTTDITSGRVPVVGWQGLGAIRDTRIDSESEVLASFWRDTSIVKSGITIPFDGSPTVSYFAVDGANSHAYIGRRTGNNPISWIKLYSEFNKPTAADVGALPIIGGTVTGNTVVNGTLGVGNGRKFEIMSQNSSTLSGSLLLWGSADRPTVFEFKDGSGYHFYSQRNKDGTISLVVNGGMSLSNWSNFDSRYQAKGNYTPAGQAYTKAESDGRFQPKGNYTPAGQAYTKAESNARYIQGWRLGAQANVTNNNGGATYANAPNGAVLTGVAQRTDWTAANYRYAQYNLNGTWYNAGVA